MLESRRRFELEPEINNPKPKVNNPKPEINNPKPETRLVYLIYQLMEKIEHILFYTLDKSIKTYRQMAQRMLTETKLDITVDQWLVMNVIREEEGVSQQEIADKVFKDNASVTRIIELLSGKGYIKRIVDKNDRRKMTLTITANGKRLFGKAAGVVVNYRKKALKGISDAELQRTRVVLDKITANCAD